MRDKKVMDERSVLNVVAGIIYNDDRTHILLAKRKPEQHQGGLWEFPGGKIEASEDQRDALARELKEELAIVPGSANFYSDVQHQYADKLVHLWFWKVFDIQGEPKGCEQQEWRWWKLRQLRTLEFPKANQCVVEQLLRVC
ncbi:MAG: 8-oxo-dGTP diphosphatase MutT [Granulosicoccaceae bacterium]